MSGGYLSGGYLSGGICPRIPKSLVDYARTLRADILGSNLNFWYSVFLSQAREVAVKW